MLANEFAAPSYKLLRFVKAALQIHNLGFFVPQRPQSSANQDAESTWILMRAFESAANPRLAGPRHPFYRKAALRFMYSDDHAVSARSAKDYPLPLFRLPWLHTLHWLPPINY